MAASRSGILWVQEPKAPDAPKGVCQWCGEPIVFTDGAAGGTKQRRRHRGDRWDNGTRDCNSEFEASMCFSARDLVLKRKDPCCVDCGGIGSWDADHEIPLWKGGPHTADNIRRRCWDCHKRKTRQEAAERAKLKQTKKSFTENGSQSFSGSDESAKKTEKKCN